MAEKIHQGRLVRLRRRRRFSGHDGSWSAVSVRFWAPSGLMPLPEGWHGHAERCYRPSRKSKAGKIEYRLDKTNIIHCPIGKVSFGARKAAGEHGCTGRRHREGEARRCQGPVYQVLRPGVPLWALASRSTPASIDKKCRYCLTCRAISAILNKLPETAGCLS